MLMFECPGCHKNFFMEDAQIRSASWRSCPNCGNEVPKVILEAAVYLCNFPQRDESQGWDVSHLPDHIFTTEVVVKATPK